MFVRGNITALEWESDFFSLPTALLQLNRQGNIVQPVELHDYALIQSKVAASDSETLDQLAQLGFVLAEGEIDLLLPLSAVNRLEIPAGVIAAEPQHIEPLRRMASAVFTLSRFRPPWYQAEDSGRFYAQWVEKAVQGTFDHCCLLAMDQRGIIEGFVTLRRLTGREARIGLLAVASDRQGRGIGQKLMAIAVHWCHQQQFDQLRVATQMGNIAALRLYIQCGAMPTISTYWLYYSAR